MNTLNYDDFKEIFYEKSLEESKNANENWIVYSWTWLWQNMFEIFIREGYINMDLGNIETTKFLREHMIEIFLQRNKDFFALLDSYFSDYRFAIIPDIRGLIDPNNDTYAHVIDTVWPMLFKITILVVYEEPNEDSNSSEIYSNDLFLSNQRIQSSFSELLTFNIIRPSEPEPTNRPISPIQNLTIKKIEEILERLNKKFVKENEIKYQEVWKKIIKEIFDKNYFVTNLGIIENNIPEHILQRFKELNQNLFNLLISFNNQILEDTNLHLNNLNKNNKIFINCQYFDNNTIRIMISNENENNNWRIGFTINNISFSVIDNNLLPTISILRDDEVENILLNNQIKIEIENLIQNENIEKKDIEVPPNNSKDEDNIIIVYEKTKKKKKLDKKKKIKKIIKFQNKKIARKKLSKVFNINNREGLNLGYLNNTDGKTILMTFINHFINNNNGIPSELLVPNNLYVIPSSITTNSAIIRVRSLNSNNFGNTVPLDYRGYVMVTFDVTNENYIIQRDLNEQQPNMGSINEDDSKKIERLKKQDKTIFNLGTIKNNSREEIIRALMEFAKNNGLLLNSQWITVEYISEYSVNAHIAYSEHNLNMNIFLEFDTNVLRMIDISSIFVIRDLGTLPLNTPIERLNTILRRLIDKNINPNNDNPLILFFNTEQLSIRNITNNSATIFVNERSNNYFGSFTVTFNLDANQGNRTDENDKNCDDSDDSSSKEKEPKENETNKLIAKRKIENKDNIISSKRIRKEYEGKDLTAGDLFIGTKNGLYLLINELIITVDNITDQVNKIDYFENRYIYALTNKEEIYFLKTDTIKDNRVVAEKIENATTTDLKKEISLFYEKKHDVIKHDWYHQSEHIIIAQTFDLYNINPLNYSKIEFLGNDTDFKPTKVSWSNVAYESDNKINDFNSSNLTDLIKNQKFKLKNPIISSEINDLHNELRKKTGEVDEDSSKHYLPSISIQPKETKYYTLVEWIEFEQDFEIAFYWEKGHYYLQVVVRQYAHDNPGSVYGGSLWMGFGNGIRLYNEPNINEFIMKK